MLVITKAIDSAKAKCHSFFKKLRGKVYRFLTPYMTRWNLQIRANSSGSRLAPPTKAPSISGCLMMSTIFADLTEPP